MPAQDSPEKLHQQFAALRGSLPRDLGTPEALKAANAKLIRAVATGDIGTVRAATLVQLLKLQQKLCEVTAGNEADTARKMSTTDIVRLLKEDDPQLKSA